MNNEVRAKLREVAYELQSTLENSVYDSCITGEYSVIDNIDIKKIDNDLGYICLDASEQKDYSILLEYRKLLYKYSRQLKVLI